MDRTPGSPGSKNGAEGGEKPPSRPRRGRRRLVFLVAVISIVGLRATGAYALCNIIPPAERSFPSTQGSVASPIVAPGDEVTIRLDACDPGPGFHADPASNAITVTFLPAGDPQAVVPVTDGIVVEECAGGVGPCLTLRFPMPDTTSATFPDGLAGPAEIRVTNGATAAVIGPLFQPRPSTTCDKQAETVFRQLTVLPPPNVFQELVDDPQTRVLAALDGSGSLLIPFDYREVLPLGPAEPVAALLSGSTTIDAFQGSGQPIAVPDSSWVRSFTIDGRPVPPLLRATNAGNEVFGASDGAEGIVRVARTLGGAPPIFDLAYLRSSGGRGPVVIGGGEYTVEPGAAVPLANLRSTSASAAFSRDESIEGNLNGAPFSPDADADDDVVQIVDVATFTNTLTGRAASPITNPITGGVVDASDDLVAFLESESQQAGLDLNADGEPATDHLLRVMTPTGDPVTSDLPAEALVGSPFPGVDRKPVAIDGDLVYFREPEVGFQAPSGFIEQGVGVAVSPDGRLIATTNPTTSACGELRLRRRDGATGSFSGTALPGLRGQCGITNGVQGVTFSPSGNVVYAATPVAGVVGAFRISVAPDQIGVGGVGLEKTASVPGAARLAVTPFTPDGAPGSMRASLYVASPNANTLTAFDVSESAVVAMPTLAFTKAWEDSGECAPSATRVCLADFFSPRGLASSPDGSHLYVAVHGADRVQSFSRVASSADLTPLQSLVDGGNGGAFLNGVVDVAVSPDGRFVYALAELDDAITIFSRNPATGLLTYVDRVAQSDPGVGGLDAGREIEVSPDGIAVYATNAAGEAVAFNRNTATGLLLFDRARGGGFANLATSGLAVSPDSEHVYVQQDNQDSGDVFARESRLRAFDASTGLPRPGLDAEFTAAKLASVASGRAAWIRPASALGVLFPEVSLYDAGADALQSLHASSAFANKLVLSSQILALAAPENLTVGNADGDGMPNEDTLVVASLSNPGAPPAVVGVDALEVGATDVCAGGDEPGKACSSQAHCPGGACRGVAVSLKVRAFNFDGGQDLALAVHREGTPGSVEVGRNVVDFEVGGNLIAFRDAEDGLFRVDCNDPDEIDFDNPDADCTDLVLRVYDLVTNQVIDTQQATIKCEQPGCEPGLPYKILGDSVAFLTREADQGNQDLDGDGDANDTVVQIFNVRTAATQVVKVHGGRLRMPPLPTTFLGAPIVYREVFEGDLGRDVNEDGDQDDVVVLVDGDSDGDGVFDSIDGCVERPDAAQLDSDGDGLGNACDPTPFCEAVEADAPAIPPLEANACQDAIAKGLQTLFKSHAKAVTSCLDRIASGKLAGPADPTCVRDVEVSRTILPTDEKTAEKIEAALATLQKLIDKKCDPGHLAQLDACGTTSASLVGCLGVRSAGAVQRVAKVAYGDVTAVGDPDSLACQKRIGKQLVQYVTAAGSAMRTCLDRVNDGKLAGDGADLCLGSEAPTGAAPPTDGKTREKLAKVADKLHESLAKPCAEPRPVPLDSCGDDAASIAACGRCTGYRAALDLIQASYGP